MVLDSQYRQRSSDGETEEDLYEDPSVETERWSVYWDDKQEDWYFYNKISGNVQTGRGRGRSPNISRNRSRVYITVGR